MEHIRILISPECYGRSWTGTVRGTADGGLVVKNLDGVVQMMEFASGIYVRDFTSFDRLMAYRNAMKSSAASTIYSTSFENDELGTAAACLKLRDALSLYGWHSSMNTNIKRIDDLACIETFFDSKKFPSLSERIDTLLKIKPDFSDSCIETVVSPDVLPLKVQALLKCCGADIKTIDHAPLSENDLGLFRLWISGPDGKEFSPKNDGTLKVWTFNDCVQAMEYLTALRDDEFELWLNEDNYLMDTWLHNAGYNTSGSSVKDGGTPRILQLFHLAMSLIVHPDNPEVILGYLLNPVCPVENHFCKAQFLLTNGGCDVSWLSKYGPLRLGGDAVAKEPMIAFMSDVKQSLENSLKSSVRPEIRAQVKMLVDMFRYVLVLAEDEGNNIPLTKVNQWAQAIRTSSDHELFDAEVGSRNVVDCTCGILHKVKSLIWVSAGDFNRRPVSSDLFSQRELAFLKEAGCKYMSDDEIARDRAYSSQLLCLPVHMTEERLIMVDIKRSEKDDEKPANPLLVRLNNYDSFDKEDDDEKEVKKLNPLIVHKGGEAPAGDRVQYDSTDKIIDNDYIQDSDGMVRFKPYEGIAWRKEESPSSIMTLHRSPLEYVLQYLMKFKQEDTYDLPQIYSVKGNVAHLTIQNLFGKDYGVSTCKEIDDHFKDAFESALRAKGLELLRSTNASLLNSFRSNVLASAKKLLKIMDANNLVFEEAEYNLDDNGKILNDEVKNKYHIDEVHVTGIIDFLTHRKDDESRKVIIDFKYTNHFENYTELLDNGVDIQLTLYKAALEEMDKNIRVDGTAYFLMNDRHVGELHTSDDKCFKYDTCTIHAPMDYNAIVDKIKNTYWRRISEIAEGRVEYGTDPLLDPDDAGILVEQLEYYNDTESHNLLPLKTIKKNYNKETRKDIRSYGKYKTLTQTKR